MESCRWLCPNPIRWPQDCLPTRAKSPRLKMWRLSTPGPICMEPSIAISQPLAPKHARKPVCALKKLRRRRDAARKKKPSAGARKKLNYRSASLPRLPRPHARPKRSVWLKSRARLKPNGRQFLPHRKLSVLQPSSASGSRNPVQAATSHLLRPAIRNQPVFSEFLRSIHPPASLSFQIE